MSGKDKKRESINLLDESTDDFQENLKLIKENKMKLANISKYLVRNPSNKTLNSTTANSTDVSTSSTTSSSSSSASSKINTKKLAFNRLNQVSSQSTNDISRYFKSSQDVSMHAETSDDIDRTITNGDSNTNDVFKCPLCSVSLNGQNETDRQLHVNKCLDKFSKKNSAKVEDLKQSKPDFKAPIEKKEEPVKVDEQIKIPNPIVAEEVVASVAEEQDVKIDDNKQFMENILRDGILNCPICGKVLHTLSSRTNHLKKCANEFHIKPDSLVDLLKRQQEKLIKSLEKGLIPSDVYLPKKRAVNDQQPKKRKQLSHIIKLEEPKTEQDEELQMAIALSNSLSKTEPNTIKLVKMKNNKDQQATLLLYDKQDRERILAERLSAILENQINFNDSTLTTTTISCLVSTKFNCTNNYLWNKCKYFNQANETFYVEIFVNGSNVQVGGQLFATKENQFLWGPLPLTSDSGAKLFKDKYENIQIIETQTAYLLADLNNTTQFQFNLTQDSINTTQNQTQKTSKLVEMMQSDDDHDTATNDSIVFLESNESTLKPAEPSCTNNKLKMLFEETMVSEEASIMSIRDVNDSDDDNTLELNTATNVLEETVFTEKSNDDIISVYSKDSVEAEKQTDEETHDKYKRFEIEQFDVSSNSNLNPETVVTCGSSDDVIEYRSSQSSTSRTESVEDTTVARLNRKRKSEIFLNEITVNDGDGYEDDDSIIECKIIKLGNDKTVHNADDTSDCLPLINDDLPKANQSLSLNQTIQNVDQENNDFDPIWNNFNENQYDDYYDYEHNDNPVRDENVPVQYDLEDYEAVETETETDDIDTQSEYSILCEKNTEPEVTATVSAPLQPPMAYTNKYIDKLKKDFRSPRAPPQTSTEATTTPKTATNNKENLACSPLTPMPSYTSMDTPNLKNQLKTFGIKVLPRKQAVRKLVEIYEFTHKRKLSLIKSKSCSSIQQAVDEEETAAKEPPQQQTKGKSIFKPANAKKPRLKKTLSSATVSSVATEESASCSQSAATTQQDGSGLGDLEQFEMNENDVASMGALNEEELMAKIKEFIFKDSDLHVKVLNYEPLEFDKIFAQLKLLGFKLSNKLLMKILDEFCITFTLKNIKTRVNKIKGAGRKKF